MKANHASVTTLRDFLECRRRGRFQQFWQTKTFEPNLFFGIAVHEAMDGYYSNHRSPEKGNEHFVAFCEKQINEYAEMFGPTFVNEFPAIDDTYQLAWRVLQNYWEYDALHPIEGEVVAVEKYMKVELQGSGLYLSGRLDLILRDALGNLWVVDHKTSADKLNQAALDVDEQLTAYAYLTFREYGVVPAGVIYNTILKKAPEGPLPLASKKGLSRAKGQLTSPSIYRRTLADLGFDASPYDDFLKYLENENWSMYFARDVVTRNVTELMNFETYAVNKVRDVCSSINDGWVTAYPAPSIYGCGYCRWVAPCKAMSDGGDWEAILNEKFRKV